MEKRILAAAVCAALAGSAGVAQAETSVFGNVNISVDGWDVDGGRDDINMNSNTSSLGVRGDEAIGENSKVIYQLEIEVDPKKVSNGSDVILDRDMWVGIQAGFGTLRLGNLSSSYKEHGSLIDPLYRLSLQGRGNWLRARSRDASDHNTYVRPPSGGMQSALHNDETGTTGREGRMGDHVRYDSPSIMGATISFDYAYDGDKSDGYDEDAWGFGIKWQNEMLLVFADYLANGNSRYNSAWKLGGSVAFLGAKAYFQYEKDGGLISSARRMLIGNSGYGTTTAASVDGADIWHVGLSYDIFGATLYFGWGRGMNDSDSSENTDYVAWTLAANYHLTENADIFIGHNQMDREGESTVLGPRGETDLTSLGIRYSF